MKHPKIIVRYLPQFHQIPENDLWWGKGFTDWTAVKSGQPLYSEHRQPRIPQNGRYYDLLQKETMEWQSGLAREYSIDGFSFYHYWFKGGRKILEKPAENLLIWQDIDMPFCFTWANETWARTWSNFSGGNTWAGRFEGGRTDSRDKGILLEQTYGSAKDWEEHIEYLLPFFRDERYMKKNQRPLFVIYKLEQVKCLPDMLDCWTKFLQRRGIPGLYIIGETAQSQGPYEKSVLDARLLRCPQICYPHMQPQMLPNGLGIYDYDAYWETILTMDCQTWDMNRPSYLCVAIDYDDTPRHGTRGSVLNGVTVEKFYRYFTELLERIDTRHEYLFVNAWNEWGEGMYLEPDEERGTGYLEAIRSAIDACSNHKLIDDDAKLTVALENVYTSIPVARFYANRETLRAMDRWLIIKEEGKSIVDFLAAQNIKTVAVYGFGYLGRHFAAELRGFDGDVTLEYIIDQRPISAFDGYPVYQLSADLPKVEAIVVTPAGRYGEIRENIRKFVSYQTISLEYILWEM